MLCFNSYYMPRGTKKSEKPIQLSPIDLEILESLSVKGYRFLSCEHLTMLYFPSLEACAKRMNELCEAGLAMRLFLPSIVNEKLEPVYTLNRAGARELARLHHLNPGTLVTSIRKPSYFFLEHSLKVSSFMCSLTVALENTPLKLVRWESEYSIRSSRGKALRVPDPFNARDKIPVIPDGLFALEDNGVVDYFFLEADRGTMAMSSIARKMLGYIQLFRRGLHRQFFDLPYFRVLFVTTTQYRRNQARTALRKIGYCPNMFLFALWKDVNPQMIKEATWLKCHQDTLHSIFK